MSMISVSVPRQICEQAVGTFGDEAQLRLLQEEAAELIVSINHFLRGRVGRQEVIEEAADVYILLAQLTLIFGPHGLDSMIAKKVERLERRLVDRSVQKAQ